MAPKDVYDMDELPVEDPVTMNCVLPDPNDTTLLVCRILKGKIPSGNAPLSGATTESSDPDGLGTGSVKPAPEPAVSAEPPKGEIVTARPVIIKCKKYLEVLEPEAPAKVETPPPEKTVPDLNRFTNRLSLLKGCTSKSCAIHRKAVKPGDKVGRQIKEGGEK
jgi:hypothetical protein